MNIRPVGRLPREKETAPAIKLHHDRSPDRLLNGDAFQIVAGITIHTSLHFTPENLDLEGSNHSQVANIL